MMIELLMAFALGVSIGGNESPERPYHYVENFCENEDFSARIGNEEPLGDDIEGLVFLDSSGFNWRYEYQSELADYMILFEENINRRAPYTSSVFIIKENEYAPEYLIQEDLLDNFESKGFVSIDSILKSHGLGQRVYNFIVPHVSGNTVFIQSYSKRIWGSGKYIWQPRIEIQLQIQSQTVSVLSVLEC